ncbi:MAG TPA: hypothetical protein VM537_15820 [Anaerolineae bacterium]|nr:hypothetical protein [Anaerolineae bacterium]
MNDDLDSAGLLDDYTTPLERRCEEAQKLWRASVGYDGNAQCCVACRWSRSMDWDEALCLHPSIPRIEGRPADYWVRACGVCNLWSGYPDEDEPGSKVIWPEGKEPINE